MQKATKCGIINARKLAKKPKMLAFGDEDVQIRQRTDKFRGFRAAGWHESEK